VAVAKDHQQRRKKMSLNKIMLIGNLGADPEVRYTSSGKPVTSFRVATNRRFKLEGELREETEWFQVVTFGRLAEICSEFLRKGKPVFLEGRLKTRTWTDNDGGKHFRQEVIAEGMRLIGKKDDAAGQSAPAFEEESEPF